MNLIIRSLQQFSVVLLVVNAVILLTEFSIIGTTGWGIAGILLLASGAFCLRVFIEIFYCAFHRD
jgi:hypothetical protein